jgi:Serine-threonine protein kinase 19
MIVSTPGQHEHHCGAESNQSEKEVDEFPLNDFLPSVQNDLLLLPCDTLLLMRSMEQNQTCLYVPLQNGSLIPTVLESQLYSKLRTDDETTTDSVVTTELQDLQKSNQIRRLTPASGEELVAWLETKHYIRAVWVAHQSRNDTSPIAIKVTTWFLSNLPNWTNRNITKDAMKQTWKESAAITLDQAIDMLIDMQVLLPSSATYLLWLPLWGPVLAAINKAQGKVLAHIKRSLYKELAVKSIERQSHFAGLSGSFVLHLLSTQGKIELVQRPAGEFARIPKK